MKILFDANVLIPAVLYPKGVCAKAYEKVLSSSEFAIFVCDYTVYEIRRTYENKFSDKIDILELFLTRLFTYAEIISTPPESEKIQEEDLIRDEKDRPVLRAAMKFQMDIIVTGDKDFLESGIENPKMVTPAEFVSLSICI